MSCRCQKRMQNQRCTCQKVNLMYIDACRCYQTDVVCKNTEHFDINKDRGYEESPVFAPYSQKKKKSQGKAICSDCEEIIISCKSPLRKLWLKYRNFNNNGFQHASSILDVMNSLFRLKVPWRRVWAFFPQYFYLSFLINSVWNKSYQWVLILNECFLIL